MDLAYFYWDPSSEMFHFNIPFLNRPILWYGFFFALGFFLGYWVLVSILKRYFFSKEPEGSKTASLAAEKIALYTILSTIIGARLGDVLFYESWSKILRDPFSVIKFWEGGLASHGGAAGILIALFFLSRKWKKQHPEFSWFRLVDLVALPAGITGGCIRLGNFMNQEVLGTATTLPWGVIFGHAVDGGSTFPRHPAQLYEAFYYFLLFGVLYLLFSRYPTLRKPGKIGGLFLIFVFVFRFLIEFVKVEQSVWMPPRSLVDMGQYLSIPMIIAGILSFFHQELFGVGHVKRH